MVKLSEHFKSFQQEKEIILWLSKGENTCLVKDLELARHELQN